MKGKEHKQPRRWIRRAVAAVGKATGRGVRSSVRWHPWLVTVVLAAPAVLVIEGRAAVVALGVGMAAVLGVWWQGHPTSFETLVVARCRSSWRREWVYRRRWRKTMWLHGLAVRFDGDDVVPALGRVRSGPVSDLVTVRIPEGQEPVDWSQQCSRLAESFGALECRVTHPKVRRVQLELIRRRDVPVVAPFPIPARPNLDGLPIGRRADGKPWLLRLASVIHVLICGATNAGKGSMLWSVIRALAGGVRDGWVQIWACDPKGGMELGHGPRVDGVPSCPLFARFAVSAGDIADLLADAVALCDQRARRLAGRARAYTPSRRHPTVVVIVDELAAVTRYATDDEIRRVQQALSILLSQGRAVGIHVIVAVQDPRKSTVKVRDLIPFRIGLRMVDADHVDATLGQLAWSRGARCEDIPTSSPGYAWVFDDGSTDPISFRASWISNADITAMAATYAAPVATPEPDNVIALPAAAGTDRPPAAAAAVGER